MTVQHVDSGGEFAPELLLERDHRELTSFLSRDIPANLFQLSWLENHGVRPLRDPDLYSFRGVRTSAGGLEAVALVISDRLVLLDADTVELARRFGRWYRRRSDEFEHVVSAARAVDPFWEGYAGESAGQIEARLIRQQSMYVLDPDSWEGVAVSEEGRPEPTDVRRATLDDFEPLFFASARMHREETLEDPLDRDPESFREHVRHRVESDRSFVWFGAGGRLRFKADISARSRYGAQISGVYTAPDLRGQGLATRALFDICERLFEEGAPRIVLYVNRDNEPARRVYEKVGFDYYTDYRTVFAA